MQQVEGYYLVVGSGIERVASGFNQRHRGGKSRGDELTNKLELGTEGIGISVADPAKVGTVNSVKIDGLLTDIRNQDVAETGDNQLIIAHICTDCAEWAELAKCTDQSDSVVYVQECATPEDQWEVHSVDEWLKLAGNRYGQ